MVEGDTLWDLSAKYLGSPWKWTEIWERNRFITNPHYIYPGIQVVIVPPGPREFALGQESASASGPAERRRGRSAHGGGPARGSARRSSPRAVPRHQAGGFRPRRGVPEGGAEGDREHPGGKDPKVGFVDGDTVYLSLRKEIPPGQLLGVYRVRGPIDSPGETSGFRICEIPDRGDPGGAEVDGQATAKVRQSFEDLTRDDLISEEIPAYTPVRIDPGADGIPCSVITARLLNKELAQGDFIYLDQGASAGVAVGNVFRVFVPTGAAAGAIRLPLRARSCSRRRGRSWSACRRTSPRRTSPAARSRSPRASRPGGGSRRSRFSAVPGGSTTARHLKHSGGNRPGVPPWMIPQAPLPSSTRSSACR